MNSYGLIIEKKNKKGYIFFITIDLVNDDTMFEMF